MKKDYIIYGDEIILKSITMDDLEFMRKWRNKDNIRIWFLDNNIIENEQQKKWFYSYINKENDYMFTIEYIKLGIKIGTVAIYNVDYKNKTAEFGRLMIGEEMARGNGLAIKATKALCNFGFNEMNLKEIYLNVLKQNLTARRVYEKVGFNYDNKFEENNETLIRMILTLV